MIAKGKATRGSVEAFDYLVKKEKNAIVLSKQYISGETGSEMLSDMRVIQALNTRCKNNTFSFVISASSEEANKLDVNQLREIKNEFLKELSKNMNERSKTKKNTNLLKHQHLAVVHTNTKTNHIHILCNRISNEGVAAPDQHIAYKCQKTAEIISKKYGFTTAWQRHNELKDKRENEFKELKQTLFYKFQLATTSKVKSVDDFVKKFEDQDNKIELVYRKNKPDELQGYRVVSKKGIYSFKASEINRKMSLKYLLERLENNQKGIKNEQKKLKR